MEGASPVSIRPPKSRMDDSGSRCWGNALKSLWRFQGNPAVPACEPDFVPGKKHLQSKFCPVCRSSGFSIPVTCVRAATPGLAEMFANTQGNGVWTRSSTNGKYRLCNHKHPCKGLPLVIFDGAIPAYDWASIPPTYVSAGSCIEMVVANGTIVPSCLVRHTTHMSFPKPSRFAAHWASSVSLPGVGDAVLLSSAPPASNPQALVNHHGKRRLEEASSSLPLASTKLDGHQPSREDRGGSSSCSTHSSTVGKTSSTSPFQERTDGADAGGANAQDSTKASAGAPAKKSTHAHGHQLGRGGSKSSSGPTTRDLALHKANSADAAAAAARATTTPAEMQLEFTSEDDRLGRADGGWSSACFSRSSAVDPTSGAEPVHRCQNGADTNAARQPVHAEQDFVDSLFSDTTAPSLEEQKPGAPGPPSVPPSPPFQTPLDLSPSQASTRYNEGHPAHIVSSNFIRRRLLFPLLLLGALLVVTLLGGQEPFSFHEPLSAQERSLAGNLTSTAVLTPTDFVRSTRSSYQSSIAESARGSPCPSAWVRAPSGSCFRASPNFAAHYDCTRECSAGLGEGITATAACIVSTDDVLFLKRFLSPGRHYWTGLYATHSAWSWASKGCPGTLHKNGTAQQLEDRLAEDCRPRPPALGDCITITGLAGTLNSDRCDWAAYQCVCELHAQESDAYRSTMQDMAHARQRSAERLRIWAATISSAAIGLPLAWSKRALRLGQLVRDWRLHEPFQMRTLTQHVGWAMIYLGFSPFVWQRTFGNWDAAQLGVWSNYTPLGPWGALLLIGTTCPQQIRFNSMVR